MKTSFTILLALAFSAALSQTIPGKDIQIKTALLAAPADLRENATVLGYDEKAELGVIKKGTNELVCLTDDPAQQGFSVACYHKDLDPYMARGRQLKKEGKDHQMISDTRESEVKSGKLVMPKQPTTLFVYSTADDKYNRETGDITEGYLRYVIYIPYATSETTGLPLKPSAPGMPWIMDPGTHKAHIMINPPAGN
jgi:hypothetical protein